MSTLEGFYCSLHMSGLGSAAARAGWLHKRMSGMEKHKLAHANIIPYSRKIWRELNLADWSPIQVGGF